MKAKWFIIITLFFVVSTPIFGFDPLPSNIVFKNYQENIKVFENNTVVISVVFITENTQTKNILIPLSVDDSQVSYIKSNSTFIESSIVNFDNQTYINIEFAVDETESNNVVRLELEILDYISEEGFVFKDKYLRIPIISNYPNKVKSNIFIDEYISQIEVPKTFKVYKKELFSETLDYKTQINKNSSVDDEVIFISANYLNLHSIKTFNIRFGIAFNSIFSIVIISALLGIYLLYFSNLLKFGNKP